MAANSALPWTIYTEAVVGRNHPTLQDTDNRALRQLLTSSGLTPDNPFYGLPVGNSSYNAASFPGATKEAQITAAIAQAAADGVKYVWIPQSMLGYNASLVTFNNAVRMLREGGFGHGFDVVAYGATADGVTNDSVAILSAASAANARSGGGTVYFSDFNQNLFAITSPLTFNAYTDVTFQGQGGPNQTRILMAASGAHCMNFTGTCSRITIRDFMLLSNTAWASGFGLSIVGGGTASDSFQVERVTIQNTPTPFNIQLCNNSTFRTVHHYQNVASATIGQVFTIAQCISCNFYDFFNTLVTGTLPSHVAVVDYDCDSLSFYSWQVGHATGHGFRFLKSAGSTGPRLCKLVSCYSESNTGSGYSIEEAQNLDLIGCESAVNTTHGYSQIGGKDLAYTGCFALSNGGHGFDIEGGVTTGLVNCRASNNSQTTTNTSDGIRVAAAYTRVVGCRSGDFYLSLTNKQRWGISIAAVDFLQIWANELDGNFSGSIQNFAAGQPHIAIQGGSGASDSFSVKRIPTTTVVLTDAATVAVDASAGSLQTCLLGGSRTIGNPAAGLAGTYLTLMMTNNTGGAIVTTWSAAWHLAGAWVDPATTKQRNITFWTADGSVYREVSRTAADVTP